MDEETIAEAGFRDAYFDMEDKALVRQIGRQNYFHDMVLRDGVRTGTRVYGDDMPPNYHLWPLFSYFQDLDLKEAQCLDIGTYDGMTAFVLSELGAKTITATCQYNLRRFRLTRAYQRYANIDYRPETDLSDFDGLFEPASFDLVVASAMLHHLTSPLDAFLEARRLLKNGGFFAVESIFADHDSAALFLNTELDEPVCGAPTLFVPTLPAIRGMLQLASFEIVSETRLLGGSLARESNYQRATFLARATQPSKVKNRTEKTQEIHEKSPRIGRINFDEFENRAEPASSIRYRGAEGARFVNIWTDRCDAPLSPPPVRARAKTVSRFSIGREPDFLSLAATYPDAAFSLRDINLLGARYPGETLPEGMSWSLKQLGNLFALDMVSRLGLRDVLEVGPGFNYYFPNHLPAWCEYTGLDSRGFYDEGLIDLADKGRMRGAFEDGLMGVGKNTLNSSSFDACISVSALEHVPDDDIGSVCEDMIRVLRPGGWAIHSIDANTAQLPDIFARWLNSFAKAGFDVNPQKTASPKITGLGAKNDVMYEPLSIRSRFYGKYRKTVWEKGGATRSSGHCATILVALMKPFDADAVGE